MVIDDGGAVEVGVAVGGERVGLLSWVWVCRRGLLFFFFFWFVLMLDYGLLVVVVSSVCSAAVVGMW